MPTTHALRNSQSLSLGGKARGLAQLIGISLNVPDGFVIKNAKLGIYPDDLAFFYQKLGAGLVAVRSSAIGEDADDCSFAGQYSTRLNVSGIEALKAAIDECVASLHNARASAYQNLHVGSVESQMCVVVQKMVEAKAAGVLFTADPVSGRYDRLILDAVEGLGESLVSGEASSDSYLFNADNHLIEARLAGANAILSPEQCLELVRQARYAAQCFAEPLDMEWAIDSHGDIFWLQARPITTIGSDLNALDTPVPPDHVLTRCNVGEVFPGACCPLTYNVVCHAVDISMQYMSAAFTGQALPIELPYDQFRYVAGHAFLDLTANISSGKYTVLTRAATAAQSICGRPISELKDRTDKKSLLRRLWGIKDFIAYIRKAPNTTAQFSQKLASFYLPYHHDSATMLKSLQAAQSMMVEVSCVHLRSSALSGTFEGIVQGIICRGSTSPSIEQQALAAQLFRGAQHVESAVLVEELDHIVGLIAQHPQGLWFSAVDALEALAWLESEAAGACGKSFALFLKQHGHRAYKELCLLTERWADKPESLVQSMQASVLGWQNTKAPSKVCYDLSAQPWLLRYVMPKAHNAIRGREYSKSLMVKVVHKLSQGYRHLDSLLVQEGKLPERGLIYFLTTDELQELVETPNPVLVKSAIKRRKAYAFQERLRFNDISVGKPEPLSNTPFELNEGTLVGRPVSHGIVEGVARVAHTLADAAELKPGEILIAPVTDVGWTPYFSLIAGLATDIGSAVSHGAVIAREYGLPCVVNLQMATQVFRTGDKVRLDAEAGVLSLVSRTEN